MNMWRVPNTHGVSRVPGCPWEVPVDPVKVATFKGALVNPGDAGPPPFDILRLSVVRFEILVIFVFSHFYLLFSY
jgi:hypothetical protein